MKIIMDKIKYLVGSNKINKKTLPPYDDKICSFVSQFSKQLEYSIKDKRYPDLKALAFWCRKKNILELKKKLIKMIKISFGH